MLTTEVVVLGWHTEAPVVAACVAACASVLGSAVSWAQVRGNSRTAGRAALAAKESAENARKGLEIAEHGYALKSFQVAMALIKTGDVASINAGCAGLERLLDDQKLAPAVAAMASSILDDWTRPRST